VKQANAILGVAPTRVVIDHNESRTGISELALKIDDNEFVRRVKQLARLTERSVTAGVVSAICEKLARLVGRRDRLTEIALRCAVRPVQDRRSAEAILGCEEDGLPR